jgi:hypothetical protein
VTVASNGTKTLAPGSYNTVKVSSKGTLIMSAGNYYINTLDVGASSTILSINATGVVNVYVVNSLLFGSSMQVKITGGTSSNIVFVTLQTSTLTVGSKAILYGTLVLPKAHVHFSQESKIKGAVYASSATLSDLVKLYHHLSPGTFPKVDESEVSESEVATDYAITDYVLEQNYPNPFNPSTMISFALPEAGKVTLAIYSVTGQIVRELANGDMPAGRHAFSWNGRDQSGHGVAAGLYLYRLVVHGENGEMLFAQTRKMAFVK